MSLTYTGALDYLQSLLNYEKQPPPGYTPEVISLDRPRALMAALGNPQERYPVLHITGTKGKGSVSAMCANILQAAGYRTGFYLSPHLQDFRERFRIDGTLIPEQTFADIIEKIRDAAQSVPGVTYWEVITTLAYEYFAQENVDVAVIEVGLGGRLDATNVINSPVVSVITSLSYDHMHLLGNTLSQIAYEKAGIVKPGRPVVCAPQKAEALTRIETIAAERHSSLTLVGRDWLYESLKTTLDGQGFRAGRAGKPLTEHWTPLIGEHQVINGTVALAALDIARREGLDRITDEAIRTGLAGVNWPGRFEVVRREPYVILDAAHNAESAERIAETLDRVFPGQAVTLVFGAFSDKDVNGMFRALLPHTARLLLIRVSSPRAFSPEALREKALASGYGNPVEVMTDASQAMQTALNNAEKSAIILVTGSVALAGEMRDVLGLSIMHSAYLDRMPTLTSEQPC